MHILMAALKKPVYYYTFISNVTLLATFLFIAWQNIFSYLLPVKNAEQMWFLFQ